MPLGSLERERNYIRRNYSGPLLAIDPASSPADPATLLASSGITGAPRLTARQQRRIRHKLGHGLRAARKPPRRTEEAQ
jgi:hypothetical protein